ncbi:LexA/Signal peptidase [Westerdykella ornata]|uniref:Mitochondrial inner membrane protease subunit n=1 Tax=Westerdykella ornata TaxID=318751 RepID=A0A6A6JRS1_WESOR|nr:LexA/Signal peptidase [Westerdykella ornata]KAF2278568.1 LexA/Signal peptidase [Westerdykella ornata]
MLKCAQIGLIGHFFIKYFYCIASTSGVSMLPTLPHHYGRGFPPLLLVSMRHRYGRDVAVGDIIVFEHPMQPRQRACKRIIGMPGDLVCVVTPGKRDEDVGKEEDPSKEFTTFRDDMIRVPEGHCWVAGDNLDWSRDSRLFGPLPLALVYGKVLAVIFPFQDAKWFGWRSALRDVAGSGGEPQWVSL